MANGPIQHVWAETRYEKGERNCFPTHRSQPANPSSRNNKWASLVLHTRTSLIIGGGRAPVPIPTHTHSARVPGVFALVQRASTPGWTQQRPKQRLDT
jgi:hypothetical protein